MSKIRKIILSRDAESLARACKAILALDPESQDSQSLIQNAVALIEEKRGQNDWKALQRILQDHIEWVNGLSNASRGKVRQMLASEGLQASAEVTPERLRRVLATRKISTASEFEAVFRYLDNPPADASAGTAKLLSELWADYWSRHNSPK